MNFIREENEIYVLNEENKKIVRATFPFVEKNVINVNHTYVDPSLRGQGVASTLMDEVYNYAKEKGYTVVNSCPYAVTWFKRHPEKSDVLNKDIEVNEACAIL
jgi:uncharacterized protein